MTSNHRRVIRSPFPRLAILTAVALGVVLIATSAVAQIDRAVLEGTVSDPSGGVIVGATVKVVAVDTGLTQAQPTNSKGYYRFPGLAVGRYTVTVGSTGFKTKMSSCKSGRHEPWTPSLRWVRSTSTSR